jgi:hypothetical protein
LILAADLYCEAERAKVPMTFALFFAHACGNARTATHPDEPNIAIRQQKNISHLTCAFWEHRYI